MQVRDFLIEVRWLEVDHRNQHDHTVTNGEDETILLRLDVVELVDKLFEISNGHDGHREVE